MDGWTKGDKAVVFLLCSTAHSLGPRKCLFTITNTGLYLGWLPYAELSPVLISPGLAVCCLCSVWCRDGAAAGSRIGVKLYKRNAALDHLHSGKAANFEFIGWTHQILSAVSSFSINSSISYQNLRVWWFPGFLVATVKFWLLLFPHKVLISLSRIQ